jgi:hypothetical protein
MSGYPDLVRAIQQRQQLFVALLVQLGFTSGTMYVWTGPGPLKDANGQVWQGVGNLGTVSDLERALVSSQTPTLTLSGIDPEIAARALAASHEVKGQPCIIFEQYFDENLAPVDKPIAIWNGLMDRAKITSDVSASTITVSTVTLLYRRRRPALAYLSDATQQSRYPGDFGCSEISRLVQATENWPTY